MVRGWLMTGVAREALVSDVKIASQPGLSKVTDRDRTATARSCTYMTAVMTALFGDRK